MIKIANKQFPPAEHSHRLGVNNNYRLIKQAISIRTKTRRICIVPNVWRGEEEEIDSISR